MKPEKAGNWEIVYDPNESSCRLCGLVARTRGWVPDYCQTITFLRFVIPVLRSKRPILGSPLRSNLEKTLSHHVDCFFDVVLLHLSSESPRPSIQIFQLRSSVDFLSHDRRKKRQKIWIHAWIVRTWNGSEIVLIYWSFHNLSTFYLSINIADTIINNFDELWTKNFTSRSLKKKISTEKYLFVATFSLPILCKKRTPYPG